MNLEGGMHEVGVLIGCEWVPEGQRYLHVAGLNRERHASPTLVGRFGEAMYAWIGNGV